MGYWLTHDSGGGAETPASVLCHLQARLAMIMGAIDAAPMRTHSILVTHSGAMRAVLRHAFGSDPGEPEFCGIITIEQSARILQPTLTYQGRSAPLKLD
jgi:broad specificity phosphatase PhoE